VPGALQRLTEEAQRTLKKLQEAEDKVTALEAEKRELRWYGARRYGAAAL